MAHALLKDPFFLLFINRILSLWTMAVQTHLLLSPSLISILHLTPKPHPNPSSRDQSFLTTLPPFSATLAAEGGNVRGKMSSLINGIKSMLVIRDNISYGHRREVEHGMHDWVSNKGTGFKLKQTRG